MRQLSICSYLLGALVALSAPVLPAQEWNAATQARSWAKQDKDESFTFFDPASRTLYTWVRDGGVLGSVPLAKLDAPPERWVIDSRNNAWVAHGTILTHVDPTGRIITSVKLPAEVGDVCADAQGFVLSYRSVEPYLEKRDFRGGLVWSFGSKPSREDGPGPQNLRPVVMSDAGQVLMADGASLNLSLFDGTSGQKLQETNLRLADGQAAPLLEGPTIERRPTAIWPGKGVVFAGVKASQIPAAHRKGLEGLALARLDYGQAKVEFLPTGLDEYHFLVGVLDGQAVFVNPRGGLMLVKIH